jgi:hypothetical protein
MQHPGKHWLKWHSTSRSQGMLLRKNAFKTSASDNEIIAIPLKFHEH